MENGMTDAMAVCTVKTPDDGQRDCPKRVEFYAKNKFEKLVDLVGFIMRIYYDSRSHERQNYPTRKTKGIGDFFWNELEVLTNKRENNRANMQEVPYRHS
jgi:hypothetical protein